MFEDDIKSFFQFRLQPFNITSDPSFFFLSEHHKEALYHLLFGIHGRKGFIEITGEIGAGKTTLCQYLLERLDRNRIKTAYIFNPGLTGLELFHAILEDFKLPAKKRSKIELFRHFNHFLLREFEQGNNVVLMLDEAQNMDVSLLEEIRMLSNLETKKTKLLQMIFVGQPELRERLNSPDLQQLRQRIGVRYHILPLKEGEVNTYIYHRLAVAGCPDRRIYFHPEALKEIYHYSKGIPRLINVVCERALISAFIAKTYEINEPMIVRCIEEIEGRPLQNEFDQGAFRKG